VLLLLPAARLLYSACSLATIPSLFKQTTTDLDPSTHPSRTPHNNTSSTTTSP
jgi:hypothetical protein